MTTLREAPNPNPYVVAWAWREREADRIADELNQRVGSDTHRVVAKPWMRWGRKHYVVTDRHPWTIR
jgi:hypothetical protein